MTVGIKELEDMMSSYGGSHEQAARDENLWSAVRQQFAVDPNIMYLNNAGQNPIPAMVADAFKKEFEWNTVNPLRAWDNIRENMNAARVELSKIFGCDHDEIAITKNCSESMQICQLGLDLKPGDEMLCTELEYFRMLTTFRHRELRDGAILKKVALPVVCEDPAMITALIEKGITSKTKVIMISHMVTFSGQIMPVREIVQMARERGIPVLVDGAQSFAHLVFSNKDMDCDFFGTSLHKWLGAPSGSGMLYIRKERIKEIWPLMAAVEGDRENIRKFEQTGTILSAQSAGILAAIKFFHIIGPKRKEIRLRYLRDRWATRLSRNSSVKLLTSLKPEFSCGLGLFNIEGIDLKALSHYLNKCRKVIVSVQAGANVAGVRVSPNIYTSIEEIDRFCDIVESVIKKGLPASGA